MRHVAIVADLVPGSRERVEELLAAGPPFDLADAGFERHVILLGNDRVVFVFEGDDVERLVRDIVDDPVKATGLTPWAPILAGPPQLAHAAYAWERGQPPSGSS